jgi:asparagine synthase (glutamine-hydrolysing)
MCGFAGGLLFPPEEFQDTEMLNRMGSVIAHRGPDNQGLTVKGPCGFVHRRLSIIDLSSRGNQPMSNENGSVWIVYNGEVYNFRELRKRYNLDSRGHVFRSATDTEVLVHLYEEMGEDFLKELNGMYSIALWDDARKKLLLARDPFGIKPLFYTSMNGGFWFASEIKSLLEVEGVQRKPSMEALYHYLSYNYVPDSLTPFSDIHELLPGRAMWVDWETGRKQEHCFFSYDYTEDTTVTSEYAAARSRELLERAVERRLVADVPVGVMLSGGMDSSALTALMAEIRGRSNFHTFSIGFNDSSFDESEYAKTVADSVGTVHHSIQVTPGAVADLLPGYLAHIDEPYGDGSAIPTWLLAEEASKHVTVLLSGEAGDEVYSGYDTHAAYKVRKLYRKIAPSFVRHGIDGIVSRLPVSHRKLSFEFKAKRFVRGAEYDVPESHFFWRVVLSEDAKHQVLGAPGRFSEFRESSHYFSDIYSSCKTRSDLNKLLCIDTQCHLPHDLMIKNDRMTMAHSIEARVPFTDVELFRFLASVPAGVKFPGMRRKHLLRHSMKDLLPESIVNKKKVGLEMPYSRWLRNELRDIAMEYLKPSRLNSTGLFNGAGVERLWLQHDRHEVDHGRALWGILNYMMWHDLYIASANYKNYINPGVVRR